MKKMVIFAVIYLSSCSAESYDSAMDRGYSDGYASGYNTTCKIRTTIISGDWDTKGYKQGYDTGYEAGSKKCRLDQPNL